MNDFHGFWLSVFLILSDSHGLSKWRQHSICIISQQASLWFLCQFETMIRQFEKDSLIYVGYRISWVTVLSMGFFAFVTLFSWEHFLS
jgi:hypothetical protein